MAKKEQIRGERKKTEKQEENKSNTFIKRGKGRRFELKKYKGENRNRRIMITDIKN